LNWEEVVSKVLALKPHEPIAIPKGQLPPPSQAGFKLSVGGPRGQLADYRLKLKDGRSIHVVEFKDRYEVHWDLADPEEKPLSHLAVDSPKWLIAALALALAALAVKKILLKLI